MMTESRRPQRRPDRGVPAMKMRTLALALATLAHAACLEGGPHVAAAPDAAPGDPAVYAPEGWPLEICDRLSSEELPPE